MPTTEQLNLALSGRYSIDRLIGEGGMATVYLARDLKLQRRAALKVLKPDLGAVLGVERFLSEIQVTANLQHPNLLPLFDSGTADSLLFYVMPYVDGESLRQRIDREKQLPIDEAVRIATAIGSALDYAHRRGVIHRDLKPENILLHEGQPQVADFGIALAVSNAGGNRITQTGLSLGTPQYMSPEQATGDRVIDGRTDIYSLGALTYEMLTGEPPHTGATSQAIIARLLTEKPRAIRTTRPNVSENIDAAVERALEKIPADRWENAKEFAEALAGTRIATRPAVSMQFAVQQTAQQGTNTTAQPYDGRTTIAATFARTGARDVIAWTVGALGVAAIAFSLFRAAPRAATGVPVEFEVDLPDSLSVISLALSRDGSTLVFAARRPGGVPALFVRNLNERGVQQIRGTDNAVTASLSPDGSEILFTREDSRGRAGGSVSSRIPIRGGTARSFHDSTQINTPISWGDGDQTVGLFRNRLWIASAEGGGLTLLAEPDTTRGHRRHLHPDVLPGGRAALIAIEKGPQPTGTQFLGAMSIPDGRVTELGDGIVGTSPRYTAAGGGHIVYATLDAQLFAVPFDAAKLRVTGAPFLVAEGVRVGSLGGAVFAVSQNGTLAYVAGVASGNQPTLVAVTRTGVERPLGVTPGLYMHPRVSPDGKQIALSAGGGRGRGGLINPDIWRFDVSSPVLNRVTTDSANHIPSWSPDGARLAFVITGRNIGAMWRPLSASSRSTPLVQISGHDIVEFSFGPAHGYATIMALPMLPGDSTVWNNQDVWLVHVDSLAKPRPFLTEPYGESSARISPDGSLIAFVSRRTGSAAVYVQPVQGGSGEVRVSPGEGDEPVWAANSREIFFRGLGHMMSAQLETRPTLSVTRRDTLFKDDYTRTGPSGYRVTNYDVLPGGNEFVMLKVNTQRLTNPLLIVIVNWHLRAALRER